VITVEDGIIEKMFDILLACGKGRNECVVFWTGPVDGIVDRIVHPQHHASPGHYEVIEAWLNAFWFQLGEERRRVVAQIHTHPNVAFHSRTDDVGAVGMHEGFVSIVIPYGGTRRSLSDARAYEMTARGWQQRRLRDAIVTVTS
jgi:hypothetical protein